MPGSPTFFMHEPVRRLTQTRRTRAAGPVARDTGRQRHSAGRVAHVAALLALTCTMAAAQTTSILEVGTQLVYESGGTAGAPWRVEAVERDLNIGGRTGCLRVRFAPGGPRAAADERTTCMADGVLFAWDTAGREWRASRPVAPNRTLNVPTRAGSLRYATGPGAEDTISAIRVAVIETTILTVDSAGRTVRRLRERYAPALGTATWGAFELPDPEAPAGWRISQEFRLVAIRQPDP